MSAIVLAQPGYIPDSVVERIATSTLPPLGLLMIAAMLEQMKFTVAVHDFSVEPLDGRFEHSLRTHRPDWVGFSSTAPVLPNLRELVEKTRRILPHATIVVGGYDATARPAHYLEQQLADVVVLGEGEETIVELIAAGGPRRSIEGLAFLHEGELIRTPSRKRRKSLDDLPLPARHLVDHRRYRLAPGYRLKRESTSVFFNRGCPHQCTFCDRTVYGQVMSYRTPESIMEELRELNRLYGVTEFRFHDDRFLVSKKRAHRLLDLMIEDPIDFKWLCAERIDKVNVESLRKMKQAGCYRIEFGIEAGNDRILKLVKKGTTKDKIVAGFHAMKEAGVQVLANFIIGFPTQTEEEILETIDFACEMDPDYAAFFMFQPYPGTTIAPEFDLPWDDNHSRFRRLDSPAYPVSTERTQELVDLAYKKFYFHPRRMWRLARQVSHPSDILAMSSAAASMLRGGFAGGTGAPREAGG